MVDWLLLLTILLCISGAAGHLLAISLLARMLNPTNLLLISMSGNQLVLCINFLYSTLFKYSSEQFCIERLWTFGWTFSLLVSVNVSVLVSCLSTFHVVAISIIRHLTLRNLANLNLSNSPNSHWFTYQKCLRSLLAIYIFVILLSTPLYFQSEIIQVPEPPSTCINDNSDSTPNNQTFGIAFSDNVTLQKINFWLFGCMAKLIPCAIIAFMTFPIMANLKRIQMISIRFSSQAREAQYHRTTIIILAIMILFFIVEFPQGILNIAQSLKIDVSILVENLFEVFTLLNSCLIFALLCSMNSRIRAAFIENCPKFPLSWIQCKNKRKSAANGVCKSEYTKTDHGFTGLTAVYACDSDENL